MPRGWTEAKTRAEHKEELLVSPMKGVADASLTPTKIGTVEVPVPPLTVHREFIASLEEIDEEVGETRRRSALLGETRHQASSELRGCFSDHRFASLRRRAKWRPARAAFHNRGRAPAT